MNEPINTEQLRTFLINTLDTARNRQDLRVYNGLYLTYITGCRACEVNLKYWEITPLENIILSPSKKNNSRIFTPSEVPAEWIEAIKAQNSVNYTQSYSTLQRGYLEYKGGYRLTLNKKEIEIHAYRHLYAKTLKEQGYTDIEIQVKMGEKHLSSAQKYIYSQFYNEY